MIRFKIEVHTIGGDWHWLGLLTKPQLKQLTEFADKLNDGSSDE